MILVAFAPPARHLLRAKDLADARYFEALGVDDLARADHMKRVEVDLRDLNFMNSSGILTLVRWITKAKTHPPADAYQLILQYDRNVTWQRTSIPTLAKLAPNVVVPAEING